MKDAFIILILFSFISCGKKPKEKSNEHASHRMGNNVIELSGRQKLLLNLKTDTAKIKTMYETITLLGKATVAENKINVISSRVSGRVDKLFARNTGEEIKSGQALYAIYSEELLSDENEYLFELKQRAGFPSQKNMIDELIQASKKKLLLWGMSEKQVNELEKNQTVSPLITFYSNVSGYITELNINEGEYVESGTPLFKIAQSNSVWVEAQVYPYELKYLNHNSDLSVEFEPLPGESFKGKIVFESPAFEQNSKISFVRIEIRNKGGKVKPGMMAFVILKTKEKTTLVIPKSSITLGEIPVVWVENETGKFEMRMVHTGIENKYEIEVLHGLKEGEKMVISGAYLINSEYIIRNGANAMAGMKM